MIRRWNLLPQDPSGQTELAAALSISKITAQILLNRGIREVEEARRFFACSLGDLPDPFGMKDMDRATDRLLRAIEGGETIVIYGDYDVDGITGASLLKTFFREIGVETPFYTPDRLKEGYGVNPASVRRLAERGTRVIITVDCGISAFEGLEEARRLGIDLIVTDHHLPPPELPPAAAILNPQRKDCPFPCKALAGVGVAFNLAIALRSRLRERGYFATRPEPNLKRFLDFVAVGTVADIVPLVGANRVMVRHGLAELSRTRRKGFQALVRVSGLEGKEITTGRVGFQLGPRINATGRVGESLNGVRLLTAEDEGEAERIAGILDAENEKRRAIEQEIFGEAMAMIEGDPTLQRGKSIVLASEGWHPGVIGIVASRVLERYYRPIFLIGIDGDGLGKGSGRSIEGFHMYDGLSACAELFENFGGHHMAAGCSIRKEKIPAFRERFEAIVADATTEEDFIPRIDIDAEIAPRDLTIPLIEEIGRLSPFGPANPEPLLCCRSLRVMGYRIVGENHLKLRLAASGVVLDAIGFRMAEEYPELPELIDVAFRPQINEWQGVRRIQLNLVDLQPTW